MEGGLSNEGSYCTRIVSHKCNERNMQHISSVLPIFFSEKAKHCYRFIDDDDDVFVQMRSREQILFSGPGLT